MQWVWGVRDGEWCPVPLRLMGWTAGDVPTVLCPAWAAMSEGLLWGTQAGAVTEASPQPGEAVLLFLFLLDLLRWTAGPPTSPVCSRRSPGGWPETVEVWQKAWLVQTACVPDQTRPVLCGVYCGIVRAGTAVLSVLGLSVLACGQWQHVVALADKLHSTHATTEQCRQLRTRYIRQAGSVP